MGRTKQSAPAPKVAAIEFEYKGRKAKLRRSVDYKITLSAVKKEFKDLHTASDDRIAFSSIVEGDDDSTEITCDKWPEVYTRLKHVMVVLDSASKPSDPKSDPETENSEPQKPQFAKDIIEASIRASGEKNCVASTMPEQPEELDEADQANTIRVEFIREPRGMMTDDEFLTTPETTILDLKAFIVSQDIDYVDQDSCVFWFKYDESPLTGKRTVRDLEMDPEGGMIQVYHSETLPR
ncbi:hypothetical protein FRC09_010652 [Ceratobasidium sp. 395]|nr:hypothetical protein FRC09_010652 [Ceratobasidium sp. 395]